MIKLLSVAIVAALFLESHQLCPGPFVLPGGPVVKPESHQLRPGPFVLPGGPVVKPGRSRPGPFALPQVPGVPVVKPGRSRPGPFALPQVPGVPGVPVVKPGRSRPGPFALPGVPVVKPGRSRPGPFALPEVPGVPGVPVVKPGRSRPGPFALPEVPEVPEVPVVKPERPRDYPTHIGPGPECWTDWFDRDDPSGSGDWETFSNLYKENPGKICPKPQAIEAMTLSGLSVATAGEVIFKNDATSGFVCRNVDQPKNKKCSDYRVRFSCHPPFCGGGVCWTNWFDRDNPSGTGDWEHLNDLRKENPGKICEYPLNIEVVTTDTMTPAISTGENFHTFNPTQGFVCLRKDQKSGGCRDYKVRFGCPCKN